MFRPFAKSLICMVAGFFLLGAFVVLDAAPALAQVEEGLSTVGEQSGLSDGDPKQIVANIIYVFLGVLGAIAIIIVLYGGFVWMTSGGNDEKVAQAKKILVRGAIGVTIILLSYAIASFVLGAILNATNGGNGGGGSDNGGGGNFSGGSSSTSFQVTDFSPEGTVAIRNVQYRVTFNRQLDGTTIDGNMTITNTSTGEAVAGTWSTSNNRATFIPSAACPSPNEDRYCFDANTTYTVSVSEGVQSSNGRSLVCSGASCTSSFTTGEVVDTEDPEVSITEPGNGDGVPADSVQLVQARVTDDSQISGVDFARDSVAFDSVGATGDDLSNVTVETLWDTADLESGVRYQLTAIALDIAGNLTEETITVRARPATCFNDTLDADAGETGVDCGGDASSAGYCGACDGSMCVEDAECASGACIDGVCLSLPEIESVSPANGAPGTFVTISGSGFGTGDGTVSFLAADGSAVVAVVPSCGEGWSDTQIVVEVPDTAVDGPIRVTTSSGNEESTDDANGVLIEDFDVNDTVRPKLCALSPERGGPTDGITLTGFDFGTAQGGSTVAFGAEPAGSYTSWSDTVIAVTAPSAADGYYDVAVTVNGVVSNALTFALEDLSDAPPSIVEVSPSSGAIGQYITLTGTNFGSRTGTVWFVSEETGESALAETDFPVVCSDDYWANNAVTVIVPSSFTSGNPVVAGAYGVYVRTAEGDDAEPVDFTITEGDPDPGICALDPEQGEAGDVVTIYGERLGSATGTVVFHDALSAVVTDWDGESITVTVPTGVVTGPVTVTSASGGVSNTLNFAVGDAGETGLVAAGPATYGWYFSTGDIPAKPEVVVECSNATVSAVPNARFTDEVCTNAVVYAEFTVDMDEATLDEAVAVYRCTAGGDEPCNALSEVEGVLTTTASSFIFEPSEAFAPATTYRVEVGTDATSAPSATGEVTALEAAVTWEFTTKATDEACEIEEVRVSPASAILSEQYATEEFNALPVTGCVVTDPSAYAWSWAVDESYAGLTLSTNGSCDGGTTSCATVIGNAEGTTDVTASVAMSAVSGDAELRINFTDPYVEQYQPDCAEACASAVVSATFNTGMDEQSVEAAGAVRLFECENELCVNYGESDDYSVVCSEDGDDTACDEVEIVHGGLATGSFYRVIIDGDVASVSGVPLTRTNYSGDFSWTFRVREDGAACAVERLSISPDAAIADVVGDRSAFAVRAYGAPDSCSVEGQELASVDYSWSWTNPIIDDANVAEWWQDGDVDTDLEDVANGCTASCIAGGSQAWAAICGDGVVGSGEDCDDSGTVNGDGCSSSCTREGGNEVGVCGDGVRDRLANGAGEDCDDGNAVNGDGCSASCLNEGSSSVDAVCGNGSIAYDPLVGGEECEDGNVRNGDGCSSRCLNEGSVTLADVGGAVCGNGAIDTPFENCDTALSSEGCSDVCLLEGSSARYALPSVCGDGVLGTGEECEGNPADDSDGCSSSCLLMGSSLTYASPSVCGDAVVGAGEWAVCEADNGDGNIDATQLAIISDTAVREVDSATRRATATVEVEEPVSGLSTTATYMLMCSAATDLDCTDPALYGVGENSCCLPRPTVSFQPNGANECRNATMYGIFTQEMDLGTFTGNSGAMEQPRMYAVLDLAASGLTSCPSGHTTLARVPRAFWARAWFTVRSFVTGAPAYAATNDCVVDVTGYSQVVESETAGTYRVTMEYGSALAANATYTLTLEVDADYTDAAVDGVRSANGVGMLSTLSGSAIEVQQFTTGSEICTLDEVQVEDTDEHAYYFTQTNEEHRFVATGISYTTGAAEEITSLPGEYAWEWTDGWTDDSEGEIVVATQDATAPEQADVRAQGENGSAVVVATATITEDAAGASVGTQVSGSAEVTAYLCENPWPSIAVFPWQDNATGGVNGNAYEGSGWMNFSTYYCRDQIDAGTGSYGADVVLADTRAISDDAVMKEYLLEVGDNGDAIGIRVVQNPEYLSPMAWFAAQGFSGDPTETEVDGFAAVTDGRTTYVSAPNQAVNSTTGDNVLYSNIYVISYNEGASSETIAIYEQILENFSFATNVDAIGLCSDGAATSTQVCDADSDCSEGETCLDDKAKLRRDTQRLADVTDISAAVAEYEDENGVVPPLSSGTYVRGLGASAWGSWTDAFGGALDVSALAVDPLNTYVGCGTGDYADYDAATCVNETKGHYVCTEGSHVYHYRAVGQDNYQLFADLEYRAAKWVNDIDGDASDAVTVSIGVGSELTPIGSGFTAGAFCDGSTVYGAETSCGDGIVGGTEVCELGQSGGASIACDANGDGTNDGTQSQVCNSTCSGWEDDTDAACVAAECGNGVIDAGEDCDDGSLNGRYGFCGSLCTYDTAFFCGDGTVSGTEACDCGAPSLTEGEFALIDDYARPYGGTPGTCAGVNGTYSENAGATCSWDCSAPAAYCGDSEVTVGETCDTLPESWEGALCGDGVTPCSSDADCSEGDTCGDVHYACPVGDVCIGGTYDGMLCNGDNWDEVGLSSGRAFAADIALASLCVSGGGTCDTSGTTYQTYRTRTCADAADTNACSWNAWSYCNIDGQTCGNGVVEGAEECDDGNSDGTDSCTSACTLNVCGDGYLYVGEEQCDEGAGNGAGCDASYGASCSACSATCRYEVSSGEFCGDGVINGTEYCDAYDMPYAWYDENYEAEGYPDGDGLLADCDMAYSGRTYRDVYGSDYSFVNDEGDRDTSNPVCTQVGICNGGATNGAYCTADAECGAGINCVMPTCAESCMSACPFTYEDASVLVQSNAVGARDASSVMLHSYSEESDAELPNAGTITIPACEAISLITADVSMDAVEPPATYVVFLTDLSRTMQFVPDANTVPTGDQESRLAIAQSSMREAIDTLFDELPGDVYIGAVGYKGLVAGDCYISGDPTKLQGDGSYCEAGTSAGDAACAALDPDDYCVDQSSEVNDDLSNPFGNLVDFVQADDEGTLATDIASYFVDPEWHNTSRDTGHGTFTYEALVHAEDMFNRTGLTPGVDNVRFITILLSDGEYTSADPRIEVGSWDTRGIELYTATIGDDEDFIAQMNTWSSNSYDGDTTSLMPEDQEVNPVNGIDYSYVGDTAQEIEAMYEAIINSILSLQVTIISPDADGDGVAEESTAQVEEGSGVTLPWPTGFACDPSNEQELPIRVQFNGSGQIEISNVQVNYCAP